MCVYVTYSICRFVTMVEEERKTRRRQENQEGIEDSREQRAQGIEEEEKRNTRGDSNCEVINISAVMPFYYPIGRASRRASVVVTTRNARQR